MPMSFCCKEAVRYRLEVHFLLKGNLMQTSMTPLFRFLMQIERGTYCEKVYTALMNSDKAQGVQADLLRCLWYDLPRVRDRALSYEEDNALLQSQLEKGSRAALSRALIGLLSLFMHKPTLAFAREHFELMQELENLPALGPKTFTALLDNSDPRELVAAVRKHIPALNVETLGQELEVLSQALSEAASAMSASGVSKLTFKEPQSGPVAENTWTVRTVKKRLLAFFDSDESQVLAA